MSKKTIYILISILVLSGIITGGYFIYKNQNKKTNLEVEEGEYKEFSPFGTSVTNKEEENVERNVKETEKFFRLTDEPISGAVFFQDRKMIRKSNYGELDSDDNYEIIPSIRYVDKNKGNIYNINTKNRQIERVSDTIIPRVHESLFGNNANSVIYRYLSWDSNIINTFVAKIGEKSVEFLENDILDISISKDKSKYFYLVKNGDGVVGKIKNFNNSNKTEIFNSPFTEWISQWGDDNKIYLTTKASYMYGGSIFEYNIETKKLSKILSNILGITSLANNSGSKILFNEVSNSGSILKILDTITKKITETNIYGLPEKCVWSVNDVDIYCATPNTKYKEIPDYWYQGLVSFEDSFVKINGNDGSYLNIFNSEEITPVDATNLFLSENENQLFFTNKKDYTLWGLILN